MGVGADSADPLNHDKRLDKILLCRKFFDTAVIVSDKDLCVFDLFSFGIKPCMDRLLKRRMVRTYRYYIAHASSPPVPAIFFSLSIGVTRICPCPSSMLSGIKSRFPVSTPSKVIGISSMISRSGHSAARS